MKIAILANLQQDMLFLPNVSPLKTVQPYTWQTIKAVSVALQKNGHQVVFLEGDETLYNNLQAVKPDICFNLCQGRGGSILKAQIPAILEMQQLPYTGSKGLTLIMDRATSKRLLVHHQLPTPPFQVVEQVNEQIGSTIEFPRTIQSSQSLMGQQLEPTVVVENKDEFKRKLAHFLTTYQQPALVEQYIVGPEIVINVVGNLPQPAARRLPRDKWSRLVFQGLHLFPPLEKIADETQAGGWTYLCPATLTRQQIKTLNWLAAAAFRVIGGLDMVQITFRLAEQHQYEPYIIDIETMPSLIPGSSPLCLAAEAEGWSYDTLINNILAEAIQRYHLKDAWPQQGASVDTLEGPGPPVAAESGRPLPCLGQGAKT